MLLEMKSPIQEFPRKISPVCGLQIGPISLRSEGPLIEAHNPYEPMLTEDLNTSCAQLVPVIYGACDGQIPGEV